MNLNQNETHVFVVGVSVGLLVVGVAVVGLDELKYKCKCEINQTYFFIARISIKKTAGIFLE